MTGFIGITVLIQWDLENLTWVREISFFFLDEAYFDLALWYTLSVDLYIFTERSSGGCRYIHDKPYIFIDVLRFVFGGLITICRNNTLPYSV